jgi:hypothetical protein
LKCLYLTDVKPSRKGARALTDWLAANYPDCSFTEHNVGKQSFPVQNSGRYQGRIDAPATWGESNRAADRLAVLDTARRLLAV